MRTFARVKTIFRKKKFFIHVYFWGCDVDVVEIVINFVKFNIYQDQVKLKRCFFPFNKYSSTSMRGWV